MLIPPWGLAVAALTVMLWIIWSDSIRAGRSHPTIYFVRVALYVITSGVLVVNVIRHPVSFSAGEKGLAILTALVGIAGAVHFFRKATAKLPSGRRVEDGRAGGFGVR